MNESILPEEKDSALEKMGTELSGSAVVAKSKSSFARLRTAESDLPDNHGADPVVRRAKSNFARLRTAPRDAQDAYDVPIVRHSGSDSARVRTETAVMDDEVSDPHDPFVRPSQVASKPSKRHP